MMHLDSPTFWLAFSLFFVLYSFLPIGRRWILALIASLAFVAAHQIAAVCDLFIVSLVTYFSALQIDSHRVESAPVRRRHLWSWFAIVLLISNLVVARSFASVAFFGISFFTFQMLGYLIDVQRGQCPAERSFFNLLTAFTSFVYISAGPIVRTARFQPQVVQPSSLKIAGARQACFRILCGLAKKAIGEMLALVANTYFAKLSSHHETLATWTAVLALAGQYYADFSGYTDIAIGIGSLMGYELPENFRTPYFSTSVADYWRRWHITLNEWFLHYVFTPLCLLRPPAFFRSIQLRVALSLILSMTLIGLWHGWNWNNLIWGLYNASLILLGLTLRKSLLLDRFISSGGPLIRRILQTGSTVYLMILGQVLTRADSLAGALRIWQDLHFSPLGLRFGGPRLVLFFAVLAGLVIPHVVDHLRITRPALFCNGRVLFIGSLFLLVFILTFSISGRPFLYENH